MDELQLGAVVHWLQDRPEQWAAIEAAQLEAREQGYEAAFPLIPGVVDATVCGHGTGRGRESHMAYWIKCGPGGSVWVQVDPRESSSRGLYNFRVRITGRACLLMGAVEAYGMARRVVDWLGGTIADEWVKGAHICLDLPGVQVDELAKPFRDGQFVTTAKKWAIHDGAGGCTGITVGRSSQRLRVNVYDKLADIASNHDGVYEQAYIDRRCDGIKPEHATRVEYQIGRDWLSEFSISSSEDWFIKLPEIVQKVTAAEDDAAYAFLRLTARVPDREGGNQAKTPVLPLWSAVVLKFRQWVGEPVGRLVRVKRERIAVDKAVKTAVSYLTGIAARWGRMVEHVEDCVEVLRSAVSQAKVEDCDIYSRWENHARKAGTLRYVFGFDAEKFDPTGRLRRECQELVDVNGEPCYLPY